MDLGVPSGGGAAAPHRTAGPEAAAVVAGSGARRNRVRALLASLAVASICAALAAAALGATGETTLVSRADGAAGVKGSGDSGNPSASADGSRVAFESSAANLDPADADGLMDVYVREVPTGETTLVSRADGAAGADANGASDDPSISADGRFVTFSSHANNLDLADADAFSDVYLRDTLTDQTTLISRADGAAGAKGTGSSYIPSVSASGRYVAFYSTANNLDPDDTDVSSDIFLRDVQTNQTTLVSRADGAAGAKGTGSSTSPSLSANGGYITFTSSATNLDPDDADLTNDIFRRNLANNQTTLISRADGAAGVNAGSHSSNPSISAAGRYITFDSYADNLDPDDPDGIPDVYLRDVQSSETTLISRADGPAGPKGSGGSFGSMGPSISADGRFIAFDSDVDNLDPDDSDTTSDIFLRDTLTNETTLVSRADGVGGTKGDGGSHNPSISADGRFVGFGSSARNLDPDDADNVMDVFLRRVEVDDVAPETTIDSGPVEGSTITTDSATFGFSSSEVESTFSCSLDGAAASACDSGTQIYLGLGAGTHTFEVAATDAAGNTDPTPAARTFTVAATASPAAVDDLVDGFDLSGKKNQKQGKKIKVTVKVKAGERVEATRSGKIKAKRTNESYGLKVKTTTLAGDGKRKVLTLKLKAGKDASKITKAIKRWRKASAKQRSKLAVEAPVKVKVTDSAGNEAKQKLVVTLK